MGFAGNLMHSPESPVLFSVMTNESPNVIVLAKVM